MKIQPLCNVFGISRQSYYNRSEESIERLCFEYFVIDYVEELRIDFPLMGCFKLYEKVKTRFGEKLPFGRDAFFALLREHQLMLRIKKRFRPRTTDSEHPFRKYDDLRKDLSVSAPCQLWVADITYIPLSTGFCYLSLLTDAYSRMIVGWKVAPDLKYYHTQEVLTMSLEKAKEDGFEIDGMIHHSDRGVQYAYPNYISVLKSNGCLVSMTQSGDPKDNAIAERVNGILKTEWLNACQFTSIEQVENKLSKIIKLYNEQRPHMSIGMKVPCELHIPGHGVGT